MISRKNLLRDRTFQYHHPAGGNIEVRFRVRNLPIGQRVYVPLWEGPHDIPVSELNRFAEQAGFKPFPVPFGKRPSYVKKETRIE